MANASTLLMYREETRAARVTVLVVLAVALCLGPFFSSLILHTGHTHYSPPEWLHTLSLPYAVISSIIYSYCSKRVLSDVKEMLGIKSHITKQEKMFKKRKSFSSPQLVRKSCHTPPAPEREIPNLKMDMDRHAGQAGAPHLTNRARWR
jgi:hypothetical protein